MVHLPLELIVLLETDPQARRLAEQIVENLNKLTDACTEIARGDRRLRTVDDRSPANADKLQKIRDALRAAHVKANKADYKLRRTTAKWGKAYPQWRTTNVYMLAVYFDAEPTS